MNVYHYHGTVQESIGTLTHVDGITTTDKPILSFGEYQALKERISVHNNLDKSKLILTSLTILGTSADQTPEMPK